MVIKGAGVPENLTGYKRVQVAEDLTGFRAFKYFKVFDADIVFLDCINDEKSAVTLGYVYFGPSVTNIEYYIELIRNQT